MTEDNHSGGPVTSQGEADEIRVSEVAVSLLEFVNLAGNDIKTTLNRSTPARRYVDHRKYLQKQLKIFTSAPIDPGLPPQRQTVLPGRTNSAIICVNDVMEASVSDVIHSNQTSRSEKHKKSAALDITDKSDAATQNNFSLLRNERQSKTQSQQENSDCFQSCGNKFAVKMDKEKLCQMKHIKIENCKESDAKTDSVEQSITQEMRDDNVAAGDQQVLTVPLRQRHLPASFWQEPNHLTSKTPPPRNVNFSMIFSDPLTIQYISQFYGCQNSGYSSETSGSFPKQSVVPRINVLENYSNTYSCGCGLVRPHHTQPPCHAFTQRLLSLNAGKMASHIGNFAADSGSPLSGGKAVPFAIQPPYSDLERSWQIAANYYGYYHAGLTVRRSHSKGDYYNDLSHQTQPLPPFCCPSPEIALRQRSLPWKPVVSRYHPYFPLR